MINWVFGGWLVSCYVIEISLPVLNMFEIHNNELNFGQKINQHIVCIKVREMCVFVVFLKWVYSVSILYILYCWRHTSHSIRAIKHREKMRYVAWCWILQKRTQVSQKMILTKFHAFRSMLEITTKNIRNPVLLVK